MPGAIIGDRYSLRSVFSWPCVKGMMVSGPEIVSCTRECGTCHVISPTPLPRQGPNLYGVVGRQAGRESRGFSILDAFNPAIFFLGSA